MLDKLIKISISIFLFLLPLYILPFGNTVHFDKHSLLVFSSITLLFLYILRIVKQRKIRFVKTPIDLPLVLIAIIYLISSLVRSSDKLHSLTSPMSTSTVFALIILFSIVADQLYKKTKLFSFLLPLYISSSLASILVLLKELKVLPDSIYPLYTTLENTFSFVLFLLPVATLLGGGIMSLLNIQSAKQKKFILLNLRKVIISSLLFLPIFAALSLAIYHLLTDQKPMLLSYHFGWQIMLEVFKDVKSFFLGAGPASFMSIFTITKPLSINQTPFWNTLFTSSSNFIFTLATEAGIISTLLFLYIIYKTIIYDIQKKQCYTNIYFISIFVLFLCLMLFPINTSFLILLIIMLAIVSPKNITKDIYLSKNISKLILVSTIIITSLALFFQGKIYTADLYFRKSISEINKNDLIKAYNFSQKSLKIYPQNDDYFRLSSNLSLQAARSLSQTQEASESAGQIQFFTQQAVDHAEKSVEINKFNSLNWSQLASVYSSLIGSVDKADELAIQAYNQQNILNSTSPMVKLNIGQFFLQFGQYGQAQKFYSQAINLKPEWNTAHYNLANLYRLTKNNQQAAEELETTLALTSDSHKDYEKIKRELEEIKKLLPAETTTSSGEIEESSTNLPIDDSYPDQSTNLLKNAQMLPENSLGSESPPPSSIE